MVEDQYVCENVDVEGEHDYDSIVSAIIMERYDANKRDAIFANWKWHVIQLRNLTKISVPSI